MDHGVLLFSKPSNTTFSSTALDLMIRPLLDLGGGER
jgi:hypothetical protein